MLLPVRILSICIVDVSGKKPKHSIVTMTKILVIDDEDSLRETTVAILRASGFEAVSAKNGGDGIELARTTLPDLIICDIRMELVNGYQMLTAIRNDSVTATTPFILMTSNPTAKECGRGWSLARTITSRNRFPPPNSSPPSTLV